MDQPANSPDANPIKKVESDKAGVCRKAWVRPQTAPMTYGWRCGDYFPENIQKKLVKNMVPNDS